MVDAEAASAWSSRPRREPGHNGAMDAERRPTLAGLTRPALFAVGAVLLLIATALGWAIFLRGHDVFIDVWWNNLLADWVSSPLTTISLIMNWVGAGWFGVYAVPVAGALFLALLRRPWSALFFIVAEAASAGVVQILKSLFSRTRPEDMLVISDHGSFPSGHVANAATLAALAFVLFPRGWGAIIGAGWVFLMGFSRTYLHAHWLTDTVGGTLIGIGTVLVLAGFFLPHLVHEVGRPRAHTSL